MLELPKDVAGGGRTELHLEVEAPQARVWELLTQIERWPEISSLYEFGRWISPEPWRIGADFEARTKWPVAVTMRYVVLDYRPPHEVRWLVHAIGIVIERWTRLNALDAQRTELVTTAIFIGKSTEQIPGEVGELLPQYTRRFYEDLKRAAEARQQ